MRVIRFVSVKRAGAADRNRAGVTETSTALALFVSRAPDFRNLHQLAFEAAIDEIKGQCLEADVFGIMQFFSSAAERQFGYTESDNRPERQYPDAKSRPFAP